jgi:hypothetical protein
MASSLFDGGYAAREIWRSTSLNIKNAIPTPSARERTGEVGRWRQSRGGADDDDVDGRYADADVGCKERRRLRGAG